MSGTDIGTEARSDVITLGGGKHNGATREIMNALSKRYVLAAPTREEGLAWIHKGRTQPKLYEAQAGGMDGDLTRDGQITRDYGVIVKAPNPWNSKATVILLFGASTHGTAAAATYFVEKRRWRRPKHFTALVQVDVTGGYNGEPTLCALHALKQRAQRAQMTEGPETRAFESRGEEVR